MYLTEDFQQPVIAPAVTDQVLKNLIEARRLLAETGWNINTFAQYDERGQVTSYCARGALNAAMYGPTERYAHKSLWERHNDSREAEALIDALPREYRAYAKIVSHPVNAIGNFNNDQTSREPVLALFDRAIASLS